MKSSLIRSLIISVVTGFVIALLNWALWLKPGVKYDPPITEAEIRAYNARPVADLESFMKARAVPMPRVEILSVELRTPNHWRWLLEASIVPACGVFIALLVAGALGRRRQSSPLN